jgi:hypothetical protein
MRTERNLKLSSHAPNVEQKKRPGRNAGPLLAYTFAALMVARPNPHLPAQEKRGTV